MLSFQELQEKKTKVKINPNKSDVTEGGVIDSDTTKEELYASQKEVSEESKESIETEDSIDEGLKQARKNVGADSCWDGYKAKGTKKKGGKEVPNCVKEEEGTTLLGFAEERAARKMNVRTKGTIKKQIAKDAAAESKRKEKKTGEYKEKPKKTPKLALSYKTSVKGEKKKKEAPRTQKGAMAYDGPNKERSQAADRVKAKTKAKQKSLPKVDKKAADIDRPVSGRQSVSDRVKSVIKKGVKRHKKATQGARVFAKGAAKGAKDTVKFAGKVKKVFTGEAVSFKQFQENMFAGYNKGKMQGGYNHSKQNPNSGNNPVLNFAKNLLGNKNNKAPTAKFYQKQKEKNAILNQLMNNETEHEGEMVEKISASGYARAKKWREDQAAKKDRDDNAKWEEKGRTHKWDGKTWNKRDKPTHEKGQGPHAKKAAAANAKSESVEFNSVEDAALTLGELKGYQYGGKVSGARDGMGHNGYATGGKVKKKSTPKSEVAVVPKNGTETNEGSAYGIFKGDGVRKLPGDKKKEDKKVKKENVTLPNNYMNSAGPVAKCEVKDVKKPVKKTKVHAYEEVVDEAKVDKGRSDYGKASIRNYRSKGPGYGEPAMFDLSLIHI